MTIRALADTQDSTGSAHRGLHLAAGQPMPGSLEAMPQPSDRIPRLMRGDIIDLIKELRERHGTGGVRIGLDLVHVIHAALAGFRLVDHGLDFVTGASEAVRMSEPHDPRWWRALVATCRALGWDPTTIWGEAIAIRPEWDLHAYFTGRWPQPTILRDDDLNESALNEGQDLYFQVKLCAQGWEESLESDDDPALLAIRAVICLRGQAGLDALLLLQEVQDVLRPIFVSEFPLLGMTLSRDFILELGALASQFQHGSPRGQKQPPDREDHPSVTVGGPYRRDGYVIYPAGQGDRILIDREGDSAGRLNRAMVPSERVITLARKAQVEIPQIRWCRPESGER
jgi:hypothetical protein